MQTSLPSSPSDVSLELFHGLWKAMVAKTLVELGIPDLLVSDKKTVAELANATGTQPELLYRFLRAAAACQLIQEETHMPEQLSERIFTSSEATQAMRVDQPMYFLIRHLLAGFEIDAWNRLGENLRTGERAIDAVLGTSLWEFLNTHPEENRNFDGAMTTLSSTVSVPLVKAYPEFSQIGVVADVGGGRGAFITAVLRANSTTHGILYDRQQVIEQAEKEIAQAGLSERCKCISGNFLEAIPAGADAYVFKNVLHDFNDELVERILKNVHRVAHPNAKVLIAELLIPETNPSFAVCGLDLNMLYETGGKQRTEQEFGRLLQQVGFSLRRVIPVGRTPYSLIEGSMY